MRGKKKKSKVWKKVSAEGLRLMKMWYKEDGKAPVEIARLLHRDKGTISRRPPPLQIDLAKRMPLCRKLIREGGGDFFSVSCRIS